LWKSVEHGDDAWWECGFREGSKEHVARDGAIRDPGMRASIRSTPRTSPKVGSDRFMVRRMKRTVRNTG